MYPEKRSMGNTQEQKPTSKNRIESLLMEVSITTILANMTASELMEIVMELSFFEQDFASEQEEVIFEMIERGLLFVTETKKIEEIAHLLQKKGYKVIYKDFMCFPYQII